MNEDTVGLFCKTFRPDFDHLANLLDSFAIHNPDNLTLTLSTPRADAALLTNRFGQSIPKVEVVIDEDYCHNDLTKIPGWIAQQLCKLYSWRACRATHYAVLDSDCYLVRDIRAADLRPVGGKAYIACGSTLRTTFRERENESLLSYLRGEQIRSNIFPTSRERPVIDWSTIKSHENTSTQALSLIERSKLIFSLFQSKQWYFYQPGQIFSRELLIELEKFFNEGGLTVEQVLKIAPWEYNWYGEFSSSHFSTETDFRISPFIHFPNMRTVEIAAEAGVSETMLTTKFQIVQMASRHLSLLRFG